MNLRLAVLSLVAMALPLRAAVVVSDGSAPSGPPSLGLPSGASGYSESLSSEALRHLRNLLLQPSARQEVTLQAVADRAFELVREGRANEVLSALDELVAADPKSLELRRLSAHVLLLAGRHEEALAALQPLARTFPGHAVIHLMMGVALGELGRIDEALEQFQQVLKLQPDLLDALYNCAVLTHRQGRSKEAVALFERYLRRNNSSAITHRDYAAALLACGRPDEAEKSLVQALLLDPGLVDARVLIAESRLARGAPGEALGLLAEAVLAQPADAALWVGFLRALLAWAEVDAPAADTPDAAQARYAAAVETLRRDGATAQVVRELVLAFAANPDHVGAANDLGVLMAGQGHTAAGLALLARASSLGAGSESARANLQELLRLLDRRKQISAELALWQGRLADPIVGLEARLVLSRIHQALGELPKARSYLQEARTMRPDSKPVLLRLGELALAEGKPNEAQSVYRSILEWDPSDPDAMLGLAIALLQDSPGPEAVAEAKQLATKANRLAEGKSARVLQVLAAAQALSDEYAAAAKTASAGAALAGRAGDSALQNTLLNDARQYEAWSVSGRPKPSE